MYFLLKRFCTIIVVLLLIACTDSVNQSSPPDYIEVSYQCERGKSALVHFYKKQQLAVLIREDQAVELYQEPTASGFFYRNSKASIRGKGGDISITIARMMPISCHEK